MIPGLKQAAKQLEDDYERRKQSGDLTQPLGEAAEFPLYIEVQTHTACNAACTCCPHPDVVQELSNGFISDELWNKLLGELKTIPLKRFIPYLNNEPFLDKRMVERLRQVREATKAYIEVSTNASMLTPEISRRLIEEKLVDELRISVFGVNPETYKQSMPGLRWEKTIENVTTFLRLNKEAGLPILSFIVAIEDSDVTDDMWEEAEQFWMERGGKLRVFGYLDRAGNNRRKNALPLADMKQALPLRGCELNRPYERMCILYNGDVILCSQDWRREEILGNFGTHGLLAVWNGEKADSIRRRIKGEGDKVSLCTKCKLALVEADGCIVPQGAQV